MLDEHIAPVNFGIMPTIYFFDLKIHTYTLFMILALVSAFICFKLTSTKLDKDKSKFRLLIIVYALLGGIIGAKLPILIYNYKSLFHYPDNVNLIFSGKTIVGGLIGGFLAVYFLKKRLNINIKTGNDIAAPAALGMAIGRIGCFFGGCCYGIESPKILGVNFGDGIFRYPTQLYEIVFDLVLFVVFLNIKKKFQLKPGILFRYLLNSYLIFRFFIEFIRQSDKIVFGISYYQIICILCVIFINMKVIIQKSNKLQNLKGASE